MAKQKMYKFLFVKRYENDDHEESMHVFTTKEARKFAEEAKKEFGVTIVELYKISKTEYFA